MSNLKETTKEIPEETIKEIPEETIKEIIFLLPVKSLLKFRSVRHSWLSFIDSPYCVKTHLSKSTPKIIINGPQGLFALDINPKNPKPQAQTSVLKQCYPGSNTFVKGSKTFVFKEYPNVTTILISSCNGLLLSHHDKRMSMSLKDSFDVILQNPYTRTFQKIPFLDPTWPGPKHIHTVPERLVFALWYDHLTDDYKVFRNCQFYGCMKLYPFFSQVNIYSLKMESYKQIAPFPYYMKYSMDETVFASGALHWVVSSAPWDNSQWIASFDVATEEYKLVEQPVYSSGDFKLFLHVLGGCLSAVCRYSSVNYDVWVMKKYGDVDSWTKMISFTGVDVDGYLKPLLYSECGKKVLIERDCRTLLWYDLENQNAESVELDISHRVGQFQAFVHLESLIKLRCHVDEKSADEKSGKPEDNDENPNKMNKKKRDDFLSKGFTLKF